LSFLFCLVGPTASGKTEIAARVLEKVHGAIVSADARQVYRFLDIGTNKPTPELRERVPVLMIDIVTPEVHYSAADFARDANTAIDGLLAAGTPFMLVGGSGLYLKALFDPFFAVIPAESTVRESLASMSVAELYAELKAIDPETAHRLHPNDRQRVTRALELVETTGKTMTQLRAEQRQCAPAPRFSPIYVGLQVPRDILRDRIAHRFDRMVAQGFVDEVQNLMRMGYDERSPALDAIGYRELFEHLKGQLTLDEAMAHTTSRSLAYAKRQMTWFRHQPGLTWIDATDVNAAALEVERRFNCLRPTADG
jgi:tRNA dimethylallyltransferase